MLSCKEASQLVSQSLDRPLPFGQALGLRLHLLMCRLCSRYERQLRFLQKAARRLPDHTDSNPAPQLSEAARQRIRRALDSSPNSS